MRTCASLISLILFFLLCIGLPALRPLSSIATPVRNFHESDPLLLKMRQYLHGRPTDFVLLGSSLADRANALADASASGTQLLYGEGYRSHEATEYLDSQMSEQLHMSLRGSSLACAGCMVADADSIIRTLVSSGKMPRQIIYGVGPRDFQDNILGEHAYHSFAVTLKQLFQQARWSPEKIAGIVLPLYDERSDYRYLIGRLCQSIAQNGTIYPAIDDLFTPRPVDRPLSAERLALHLNDYKSRYQPIDQKMYRTEWYDLSDISAICRSAGTELVLVNMPLSGQNKKTMAPGFYESFRAELKRFSSSEGICFIDLDGSGVFNRTDFSDSVHLNTAASQTALRMIASHLAADSKNANSTRLSQSATSI